MIDVVYPEPPLKEIPGISRLQNLSEFTTDIAMLIEFTGEPLTKFQTFVLKQALDSLLFGEQA
jgi:hypothetical protein